MTETPTPEDIEAFFKECQKHDHYYMFSDDGNVYRRGESAKNWLKRKSTQNPVFARIWNDWNQHMFTGPDWQNERAPLPILEDYL